MTERRIIDPFGNDITQVCIDVATFKATGAMINLGDVMLEVAVKAREMTRIHEAFMKWYRRRRAVRLIYQKRRQIR